MNVVSWWLTVPALIAAAVVVGFGLLAIWIRRNAPAVGARWNAAVEAENARCRVPEEVIR